MNIDTRESNNFPIYSFVNTEDSWSKYFDTSFDDIRQMFCMDAVDTIFMKELYHSCDDNKIFYYNGIDEFYRYKSDDGELLLIKSDFLGSYVMPPSVIYVWVHYS